MLTLVLPSAEHITKHQWESQKNPRVPIATAAAFSPRQLVASSGRFPCLDYNWPSSGSRKWDITIDVTIAWSRIVTTTAPTPRIQIGWKCIKLCQYNLCHLQYTGRFHSHHRLLNTSQKPNLILILILSPVLIIFIKQLHTFKHNNNAHRKEWHLGVGIPQNQLISLPFDQNYESWQIP